MPSLLHATDSSITLKHSTKATSNELFMRNAFLIYRLVILALLTNFALLSLIFSAWNISATLYIVGSAPGTSILIIFEDCVILFFVGFAVADFFVLKTRYLRTVWECGIIGVLSVLHLGSAIGVSVNSFPVACYSISDHNICASASLLMPLTWLNSIILNGYFLSLFMTTLAHKNLYPNIWTEYLYDIEWFGQPLQQPSKDEIIDGFLKTVPKNDTESYFDHFDKIDSTATRKKLYRPDTIEKSAPGAIPNIRRGVDPPFATKSTVSSPRSAQLPPILPLSLPNRTVTLGSFGGSTSGSRFIERFRESTVLARSETTNQYVNHYHTRKDSSAFPRSVDDVDLPIPLPRLSEWVRVDANVTGGEGKKAQDNNNLWI